MSPSRTRPPIHWRAFILGSMLAIGATASLKAQTLTWDGGQTGGPAGGTGTWDAGTTADWYPGTGPTDTVWVNGFNATFGGTAGTATIAAGGVTANSLLFNTGGYTVGGGTQTLGLAGTTPQSGIATGTINTNNSGTTTISSVIAGTVGLTKTGAGTLTLTGANTFTGALAINAGTLQLGDGTSNNGLLAATGVTSITVGAGATYALNYLSATNVQGTSGGLSTVPITGAGNITLLGESGGYYGLAANRNPFQISGTTTINLSAPAGQPFFGTVFIYDANVLSANSVLNVLSGQILSRASNETIAGLTNSGTAVAGTTNTGGLLTTDQGSATYTINTATGTSYTYGGVIGKSATLGNNNERLVKSGLGTQILTGLNTYTGPTTINAGTLTLDATNGGTLGATALTFGGTGTFNYQGATAGSTQTLGALTFSGGGGTVQSIYGTSGNTALTFASLGARAIGATGNFVTSGGTNGTTNSISFTTAPATGTVISPGLFFNGADYATYDTGGFVRAFNYATDATGVISPGGATFDTGATFVTGTAVASTSDINMTGAVTAQPTAVIDTLKISNNSSLTLAGGSTLSFNGILQSGNTAGGATISGGTGIQGTAAGAELVVRTDGANDTLTISTPILGAQTGALTKSGDGKVITTAANTIAGPVYVSRGTLQVGDGTSSNAGTLGGGVTALTIGAGATYAIDYNVGNNLGNGFPAGVTPTGAGNFEFLCNTQGFYSLGGAGSGNLAITGATILNMNPTSASQGFNATVFLQTANALSPNSVLTIASGVVDMRASQTAAGLSSTLPAGVTLAAGTTNNGGAFSGDQGANPILTLTPAVNSTYTYAGTFGRPATNAALNGGTANNFNNAAIGLTINGAGTQVFNGIVNYTGATTVSAGTLQFGDGTGTTAAGLTSSITVAAGANLIFNNYGNTNLFSTIAGTGNVTFQGETAGFFGLNAALTNTGTLTVALNPAMGSPTFPNGTIFVNGNNILSANSVLNVISGAVDIREAASPTETIAGLTGSGGFVTTDGGRTVNLTIAPAAGTSYAYGGVVGLPNAGFGPAGTFSLAINGAGTQVLGGANTYAGTTTINGGGTLLVNGTHTGGGAYTVGTSGGGTGFTGILGGTGMITAAVTVNAGSTLAPNTIGTVGTLTTGALTLTSSAIFNADLLSTATYDKLVSNGAVNLGSASATLNLNGLAGGTFAAGNVLTLISGSSLSGTFSNAAEGATVLTFDGFNFAADYTTTAFNLDVVAVPEPSTWVAALRRTGCLFTEA